MLGPRRLRLQSWPWFNANEMNFEGRAGLRLKLMSTSHPLKPAIGLAKSTAGWHSLGLKF